MDYMEACDCSYYEAVQDFLKNGGNWVRNKVLLGLNTLSTPAGS
jgi:hypothetical protein